MSKQHKSKALQPMLIIPDTHRPYHDKRAWALMLSVARALKPEITVVLGDFADFFGVSSHSKDPNRALKLDAEIKDVNVGLDELDRIGSKRKVFVAGNHCSRLTRYLQDKAPELFNLVSIPELLKLKERGWEYVPYKSDIKIGKVHFTHDIGSAGRKSVFDCLDVYQHSNVTGHTHRMAYVVEGNAVGEHKVSAQFGWLGDVSQADYMHRAKALKNWALGFGIGYLEPKSGVVYLTPVPIVNYTCVVSGRMFKV
jgi:predicted phosphodiesterase